MKITNIWFDSNYIYCRDADGRVLRQSLLWYPRLRAADDEQRNNYSIGYGGIHWRNLDEDISYDSFEYDDAEPTTLQRFFLTHPDIDVAQFARSINISPLALRSFINGFAKPIEDDERAILARINTISHELHTVSSSQPQ